MISRRKVKQEKPESSASNEADSDTSRKLRKVEKELTKTNKEVQDLRALLQSTSEANDAKLSSLQAQIGQTTREVHDFRQGLQVQLDTIIRMVSGGPWMFNQAPSMFTQPPVYQNFTQPYIVNQGALPPTQMYGIDDKGISQPPSHMVQVKSETPDVPQEEPVSGNASLPITTARVDLGSVQKCLFCKSLDHSSANCTVMKLGNQRLRFVMNNRLCKKCLNPIGDDGTHYPCTTEKCTICSKEHNPMLCTVIEKQYCEFCNSHDHYGTECPEYFIGVSVTDRRARLEREDRCLFCFKSNSNKIHYSCQDINFCRTCMKKYKDLKKADHHKFICLEQKVSKTVSSGPKSVKNKGKGKNHYDPYAKP